MFSRRIRKGHGLRHFKAQATIELTLAILAFIIFVIGVINLFLWLNKCLIERQVAYQNTRTIPRTKIADFYTPKNLTILKR